MTLRAVFLDMGGTLIIERPSRYAIYAGCARERGIEIDSAGMRACMRSAHAALPLELDGAFRYSDPWFRAFIRRIFQEELGLPAGEVPGLTEELFARFEDPATFHLFPGLHELLERLRARGLVLGVVSNWSARLPRLLAGLELTRCFDFVLCSALEGMEKPDPAFFQLALERAGVAPHEALHAGDHPQLDVQGALAGGLEAVLVDHRGSQPPVKGVPLVKGLFELERVILERCP